MVIPGLCGILETLEEARATAEPRRWARSQEAGKATPGRWAPRQRSVVRLCHPWFTPRRATAEAITAAIFSLTFASRCRILRAEFSGELSGPLWALWAATVIAGSAPPRPAQQDAQLEPDSRGGLAPLGSADFRPS